MNNSDFLKEWHYLNQNAALIDCQKGALLKTIRERAIAQNNLKIFTSFLERINLSESKASELIEFYNTSSKHKSKSIENIDSEKIFQLLEWEKRRKINELSV